MIWMGTLMPKRKEPELKPAEQFKRFREAAKRHGIEESSQQIEQAFERLARNKRATPKKADQSKQ